VPLTFFDLDLGALVCTDPELKPPETFVCGGRDEARPGLGGGSAAAAAESAMRHGAGSLSTQLYLHLMRRTLSG